MSAPDAAFAADPALPLAGVRVVEFCQMVMGPSCGLILADLGAEVIKVEPIGGERTRRLPGMAAGFFTMFARNKRSVALDVAKPAGRAAALRLIGRADALIENFRPGMMARWGLGYDDLAETFPRLVYCAMKGFLPGPYAHRTALDEVAQMMGGLAYMTGPPGRPMRAGASVNDIMGGMFGVIAILAALRRREATGRGGLVQSALYENNVFLMGQAMLQGAISGAPPQPWSVRSAPWPVYDLFETADGDKLFLAAVGEEQWAGLCRGLGLDDWLTRPDLADNAARAAARDWTIPALMEIVRGRTTADLVAMCERAGVAFAPVRGPHDLADDPHLLASGGLHDVRLPDGRMARAPALPLAFDDARPPLRAQAPTPGADTRAALREAGLTDDEIARLAAEGAAAGPGLA